MDDISENLRKKGWSQEEITKASRILQEATQTKSTTIVIIDKIVYWTGLILAIVGNFVISVILIPFLILIQTFYLYLALLFLGVVFGWVFSILIQDIESIREGQRIVAWIFIPAIALINVYVMANLSNHIANLMGLHSGIHEAPLVSVVYVLSFRFPYAFSKLLKRSRLKQA